MLTKEAIAKVHKMLDENLDALAVLILAAAYKHQDKKEKAS